MSVYRLPCGCLIARRTETVIEQCACCAAEWNERHQRAAADYRRGVVATRGHWFETNSNGFSDGVTA
jgi:hypothetical protein